MKKLSTILLAAVFMFNAGASFAASNALQEYQANQRYLLCGLISLGIGVIQEMKKTCFVLSGNAYLCPYLFNFYVDNISSHLQQSFAKLLPLLPSSFVNTHEQGVSKVVVAA